MHLKGRGWVFYSLVFRWASLERQVLYGLRTNLSGQEDKSIPEWLVGANRLDKGTNSIHRKVEMNMLNILICHINVKHVKYII